MRGVIQYGKSLFIVSCLLLATVVEAQSQAVSEVWRPDLGSGYYQNPVINADYSDPDVCQMADGSYLLTASSFASTPGLPLLRSWDLVNWQLVGHAIGNLSPLDFFQKAQNGRGVWAPSIRYHSGEYYIYWGDPDFGIYMIKTHDPLGQWSDPVLVKAGRGLIDPCPLWADGKLYLVHAYAASRAGINSMLVINRLSPDGEHVVDDAVMVFDGNDGTNHTVEGPKLYQRGDYFYIFAPAGGVATGWQLVLRSKNIYGPYEKKIVMSQGSSQVNGPHQGAWISTDAGEDWFIHFQDKGVIGRVIHLNPMQWIDDWPVIGADSDGDGCGTPVEKYRKPKINAGASAQTPLLNPAESDEFNSPCLGLQWEWSGNRAEGFGYNTALGYMRIYAVSTPDSATNLWEQPNLLLQKFPSDEFTVTTKLKFTAKQDGESVGLIIMGRDYSRLALRRSGDTFVIEQAICHNAEDGSPEQTKTITTLQANHLVMQGVDDNLWKEVTLRVKVSRNYECHFSYSLDGQHFAECGQVFTAQQGKWVGARMGIYCITPQAIGNRGWADFDWFRVTK